MDDLIYHIFINFNDTITTIDILDRETVIYNKRASRVVYRIENTKGEKFICKTFPWDMSEIIFKEKLYSIFLNSPLSIPAIQNNLWIIIQKNKNLYYILFKFCDILPIRWPDLEDTIVAYMAFYNELQKIENTDVIRQYRKDIISTILRLSSLPIELVECIWLFSSCDFLQKKLISYLNSYYQYIDPSWIHGSLWRENIYRNNWNIIFIDFDNCTHGDVYYDYASIALMFYVDWCDIDTILYFLMKNISNFDRNRFQWALLFVAVKVIRNNQLYQREETRKELYIGLNFYFQICNYQF